MSRDSVSPTHQGRTLFSRHMWRLFLFFYVAFWVYQESWQAIHQDVCDVSWSSRTQGLYAVCLSCIGTCLGVNSAKTKSNTIFNKNRLLRLDTVWCRPVGHRLDVGISYSVLARRFRRAIETGQFEQARTRTFSMHVAIHNIPLFTFFFSRIFLLEGFSLSDPNFDKK